MIWVIRPHKDTPRVADNCKQMVSSVVPTERQREKKKKSSVANDSKKCSDGGGCETAAWKDANDHAQADSDISLVSQAVGVIASTFHSLIHRTAHAHFALFLVHNVKFFVFRVIRRLHRLAHIAPQFSRWHIDVPEEVNWQAMVVYVLPFAQRCHKTSGLCWTVLSFSK